MITVSLFIIHDTQYIIGRELEGNSSFYINGILDIHGHQSRDNA